MPSSYRKMQDKIRNEARDWIDWCADNPVSWEGIAIANEYFTRVGKRYRLLEEFRENGVI